MNKSMVLRVLCLVAITCLMVNYACAIEIVPYEDSEFMSASASLSERKDVSFSCVTYYDKETIKITACWLQKKNGNTWSKVCTLQAPTVVMNNINVYAAVMDYSSSIGTGTYRIGFTVNADGHAITRYSNEQTF